MRSRAIRGPEADLLRTLLWIHHQQLRLRPFGLLPILEFLGLNATKALDGLEATVSIDFQGASIRMDCVYLVLPNGQTVFPTVACH